MNILTAIHRLAENGSGNRKKLQGSDPPEFRLRVGDHRVRFTEVDVETLHTMPSKIAKTLTAEKAGPII